MMYKGCGLSGSQKMHAEKVCRYLLNYQNGVFNELFVELAKDNSEYAHIEALMQQYQCELKQQRVVFVSIESEAELQMGAL